MPVAVLAGLVVVALAISSTQYGLGADELYFITVGRRPSWSYADQPWLVPLLAAALDAAGHGSPLLLRLPAVLVSAGNVVLAALLARELGGRSRAQILAAAATSMCTYLLSTGRLLATSTLDPFCWSVILLLLARWIRQHREGRAADRWLLAIGLAAAVALAVKLLVLALLAGLLLGVLVAGPRQILWRPLLWTGAAIASASTVPYLAWQARHDWPQLEMAAVVAEDELFGNRWQLLPFAWAGAGIVPGAVLVAVGLWCLLWHAALRPWRCLGVAVLIMAAVFVAAGGRSYYLGGCYVLLMAAGAVAAQLRGDAGPLPRRWRWPLAPVAFAASGALAVVSVLPIGPPQPRIPADFVTTSQVGWVDLTVSVADRRWSVHEAVDEPLILVASNYWYAAALEYYGPAYGLPQVFSGHRGYGYLAAPPGRGRAVLVGEFDLTELCAHHQPLAPHRGAVENPINGQVAIALCTPRASWVTLWPTLRRLR